MLKNRKLSTSCIRSFHRINSLSLARPQIPHIFPLPLHLASEECRVSGIFRCNPCFSPYFGFLSRNICSESVERSVGRCWNCGTAAQSRLFLACGSCRSVQPVDPSVDYFQIFGLEKRYDVKSENLESKYKDWQKKIHPDLVHSKSEREKTYAAEQSARVIDAYRTLCKPLSRALYLMQLEGEDVDEEKTVSEPELLTEMMEIREAVEEAGDPQALKQIQSQIQQKLEDWSSSFETAYKNREFESAATSIQRMRYYERALESILKKL